MKPDCRTSTPAFLDPAKKMCGSCSCCHTDDPYNPNRTGFCSYWIEVVKLTARKDCWGGKPV